MKATHCLSQFSVSLNPKKKFKLNPGTRKYLSNFDKSWHTPQIVAIGAQLPGHHWQIPEKVDIAALRQVNAPQQCAEGRPQQEW